MNWSETTYDYILEADWNRPDSTWQFIFKRLDHGVKAFFLAKGNERKLVKIYFSKITKNEFPFSGAVFKGKEDCQRWLQVFIGKIVDKVVVSNNVSRYEASALVSLNTLHALFSTYHEYGKDQDLMKRLNFLINTPEHARKKTKKSV